MLLGALTGKPYLGGYFCESWELRVTSRCLAEDLGVAEDADFAQIQNREIIETFIRQRSTRIEGTRKLEPLTNGGEVWIFGRGHKERGTTVFDEVNKIVWLLTYHSNHRSGEDDDYIPVAKQLDSDDRLMPTPGDYKRYFDERSLLLAKSIMVEAPLLLAEARKRSGVIEATLGHGWGTKVLIEVDEDMETVVVVFDLMSTPYNEVPAILAAFIADADWYDANEIGGRALDRETEIGFAHLHDLGSFTDTEESAGA